MAGGLGGLFFVLIIMPAALRFNFLNSAIIIDKLRPASSADEPAQAEIKREISIAPETQTEEVIKKTRENIVAVKSYQGGSLIRYGSGVVVTQDGLIVTLNSVVPPEATSYQVASEDKIWTGKVVRRDARKKLALIKISETALRPVTFNDQETRVGSTLVAVGKITQLQKTEIFSYKMFVNMIDRQNKRILLDGQYQNFLGGAGLFGEDGAMHGLIYIDGRAIKALPSVFVQDFISGYLK